MSFFDLWETGFNNGVFASMERVIFNNAIAWAFFGILHDPNKKIRESFLYRYVFIFSYRAKQSLLE